MYLCSGESLGTLSGVTSAIFIFMSFLSGFQPTLKRDFSGRHPFLEWLILLAM